MAMDLAAELIKSLGFAALAMFFIKRYITSMDNDVDNIKKKVGQASERVTKLSDKIADFNELVTKKFSQFDEKNIETREDMLKKVESLRIDIKQMKSDFSKENEETQKEYGKIIFKVLGKQESKINKIVNFLNKK